MCWWYFQINHSWLAEQSVFTYINAPLRAADLSARGRFTSLKQTSFPSSVTPVPSVWRWMDHVPFVSMQMDFNPKLMDNSPRKPNNTLPPPHTHKHTRYLPCRLLICQHKGDFRWVFITLLTLWHFQHSCRGSSLQKHSQ